MQTGIFYKPKHLLRATICMIIAVVLFVLSITNQLDPLRTQLDNITNKVFIFNNAANQFVSHISSNFKSVDVLSNDNNSLEKEVAKLKFELSNVQAIKNENQELHKLLGIVPNYVSKIKVVRLIDTEQGLRNDIIFLDAGTDDGIFIGQNIFDATGLVGQIISVSDKQSRALLLTDLNSNIPVYDLRTNEQLLVHGTNSIQLQLKFFNPKAKLQVGDLLYSSGLGDRYVKNYPVARITTVKRDSGNNVISAYATPTADLSSLKYLVAVWPACHNAPKAKVNPAIGVPLNKPLGTTVYPDSKSAPAEYNDPEVQTCIPVEQ